MAINLTPADKPVSKTVDQDTVDAVGASIDNKQGYWVSASDLDKDGDQEAALRNLRAAGYALGVSLTTKKGRDGSANDGQVWFVAVPRRTRGSKSE